jgi:uncharacterized membrane protein
MTILRRMTVLRRVWVVAAGYALVLFALGIDRFVTYHAGADLGLFTQSIASVFRGFSNTVEGGSHFTFHFSPILYLCAPFLLLAHSALALTALQAIGGALAIPPAYLLARKRLPEATAFLVACVTALYPPLVGVTFTDFHENGFAAAATLWLFWALDVKNFRLATAFLVLALSIKEDQAAMLGCAGLLALGYFVRTKDRERAIFAAATCAASALTLLAFFEYVRPLAGAKDLWAPSHFYRWAQDAVAPGLAPWNSIGRPAYVLEAMLPLAFVCLLSPACILALPGFVEVLASHESLTYTMGTHYAAVWIPYLLFAFIEGLARLREQSERFANNAVYAALALCVIVLAVASPTHWGHYLGLRTEHDAVLDRAAARVSASADVGTFDEMYAHIGFNPNARLGLGAEPRYALLDSRLENPLFAQRWRPILRRDLALGAYRLLWTYDGVELYERRGGTPRAGAKPHR